jgi:hypothetical protein
MRIGVLLNCHGQGIAASLRALLPEATVHGFLMQRVWTTPALQAETAKTLSQCDHILTWKFGPRFGPLATAALRRGPATVHMIPPFHFRGFHPDTMRLAGDAGNIGGPTGAYHSRIAIAGYLAGLSVADTVALYNRLVFARLDYITEFARQKTLLAAHLAAQGFDGAAILAQLLPDGCFMHSFEHPKPAPLLEMARAICARMDVTPAAGVSASQVGDTLAVAPIHPFFPDLAAALGLPPDGVFRNALAPDGSFEAIEPAAFVAGSFEMYARVKRETLMAADGVEQALAALGFNATLRSAA